MTAFAAADDVVSDHLAFRSVARRLFGNIKQRFVGEDTRRASLTSSGFGACRISRIEASPHGVLGDHVCDRSHRVDAIKLLLQVAGTTRFRQGDRVEALSPGTWVIYDPTRPYFILNTTGIEQIILQLPRQLFPRPALALLARPRLFRSDAEGLPQIIAALASSSVKEAAALDAVARARVGETLAHLAISLVGASEPKGQVENASLELLCGRVKAHITAHCRDTTLTVDSIAALMGCSRRYIYRAFEADATSPERFLWDTRLDRCRDRLATPESARLSISEIAFAYGFNSSAHFSRAFKERFGRSPREFRRAAFHEGRPASFQDFAREGPAAPPAR
jgi:AraC-like DNA-binding protein